MAIDYYVLYRSTIFLVISNTIFYLLYWVSFVKYLENDETLVKDKTKIEPNDKEEKHSAR